MKLQTNRILISLNNAPKKDIFLSGISHIGYAALGTVLFGGIVSILSSLRSLFELWKLTNELQHPLYLSRPALVFALIAFVFGSWSVGRTLAHGASLVFAKLRTNYAPH
jgi:hypothetical protein